MSFIPIQRCSDEEAFKYLARVRERIADPKHWTDKAWARDAFGNPCKVAASAAVAWSGDGAMRVAVEHAPTRRYIEDSFLASAARRNGHANFQCANDLGGHAIVLAILDECLTPPEAE